MRRSVKLVLGTVAGATLAAVAATGCGSKPSRPQQVEASAGPPAAAEVDHVGTDGDSEPEPRGTLVLRGSPDRYLWIQALATAEEYEIFADGEQAPSGIATRKAYQDGGEYRLAVFDPSVAETDFLPYLFSVPSVDGAVSFLPVSPEDAGGLTFHPEVDPVEALPEGVSLGTVPVGGASHQFTTFEASLTSLLGLLLDRQQHSPHVWSGEVEPGRPVVVIGRAEGSRVVVVHGADDRAGVASRSDAVFDSVEVAS